MDKTAQKHFIIKSIIKRAVIEKDGLGVGIGGGALVPQNLAGADGDNMPLKRKKKITVLGTPVAGVVKQKIAQSLIKHFVLKAAAQPGTRHKRKDGFTYEKQSSGEWARVDEPGQEAAAPIPEPEIHDRAADLIHGADSYKTADDLKRSARELPDHLLEYWSGEYNKKANDQTKTPEDRAAFQSVVDYHAHEKKRRERDAAEEKKNGIDLKLGEKAMSGHRTAAQYRDYIKDLSDNQLTDEGMDEYKKMIEFKGRPTGPAHAELYKFINWERDKRFKKQEAESRAKKLGKSIVEKAYPVGTIRQHKDGKKYKKTGPGQWSQVTDGKDGGTAVPVKPEHAAELESEDIAAGDVSFKGMSFQKMAGGFMAMKPTEPEGAEVLKDAVKDLKGVMYNGANKTYIVPPIHANAILKRTADKYETKLNETIGKTGQLDLFAIDELDKIDDMKKIARTPPPETPVKTPDGKDGKIIDRKLDKDKNPVFTVQTADGKTTEVTEKKLEVKPQTDDKKIAEIFENASPENREQAATALNGGKMSETPKEDLIKEIYPPKKTNFVFGQGEKQVSVEADDITGFIVNGLADDKDLYTKTPIDIDVKNETFLSNNCHLPKLKIGPDRYFVSIGDKSMIMTGAAVVYNQDKLFRRAKQEAKKKIEGHIESYKKLYPDKSDKEIKEIVKKRTYTTAPKILPKNKMSIRQFNFIKNHHDSKNNIEIQRIYTDTENELAYRAADLKSYREDYESSFQKGRDTSYGPKNESGVLKDKYGVTIKRQNGDDLTPDDIKTIGGIMETVNGFFGDHKTKLSDYNLRVSYSGEKRMHAKKAIGLFDRRYGAIGISDVRNQHSTAIHEFAHLHDHLNRPNGFLTFASHQPGTVENDIAEAYRRNLPDYGGDVENYWFRSHECFARAVQQYYESKTTQNYYSNASLGENNLLPDMGTNSGYYCEKTRFESDLIPLVEKWLNKNKAVKKSLDRMARARAVWMGGKSTPFFLGDK